MMSHRVLVPVFLLLITTVYIGTAYTYDEDARNIPLSIAAVLVLLLFIELVMQTPGTIATVLRKLFTGSKDITMVSGEGTTPIRKEIEAFAWIVGFLILAIVLGFYIAIPIYVFSYLHFYAGKSVLISAIPAIVLDGLLYLLFHVMLGYEIFAGLIMGDYL